MLDLKLKATPNESRIFAVSQLVLAAIIAWWLHRGGHGTAATAVVAISSLIATVGLVKPAWTAPLYAAWMLAAFPIGWMMSYVMAGLAYFLVVTPIGLVMRVAGREPITRGPDELCETYWTDLPPDAPDPKRYFRQF